MTKHRVKRRRLDRRGVKILKLASGAHAARWVDPVDGRSRQQNLDVLGLTNAEGRERWARDKAREIAEVRAAVTSGSAITGRVTIEEAMAEWLKFYQHGPTRESYEMIVGRFVLWAQKRGLRDVQDLVGPHLTTFTDHYVQQPARGPVTGAKVGTKGATARRRKPSTIALAFRVIRTFLQWARKRGLTPRLSSDVIREAVTAPAVPKQPIEVLQPSALKALLEASLRHDRDTSNEPIAPFLMAVLLSGGRFAEIADLEWSEVDLRGCGALNLPSRRVKTRAARVIKLDVSPGLKDLLQRMKLRASGPLVFAMPRGRAEDARRRLQKHYGAPTTWSWQTLRRTAASLLTCSPSIFGAASVFMAARRAGHSVALAEASYLGVFHDLPKDARTIEQAAEIEAEVAAIVASVGGAIVESDEQPAVAAG